MSDGTTSGTVGVAVGLDGGLAPVDLLTRMTYRLIRPFEAVALLLQAMNLFASAVNDRYQAYGLPIVIALGFVHLGLAGAALRYRGPLTRGKTWTAAWIAMIFVVQMLFAHILAPGDYAAYGVGVPMSNYSLIPLAVFAFYPWGEFRDARRRRFTELCLIVAFVAHPAVIIALMSRWNFTSEHLRSLAQHAVWAVVWFLVGKGIARLCRISAQVQTDALTESYHTALGDLHTHVDGAARQIEAGQDPREVARGLRELVATRRRQLLLADSNVGVVDIVKNAVRAFGDRLHLQSAPHIGALTIPRESAILLEQGLADLLKNVVEHADGVVDMEFIQDGDTMVLDVRDHGPGLEAERFAEPGSGLSTLRARLKERGGDLELLPAPPDGGAAVRLSLPIRLQERR